MSAVRLLLRTPDLNQTQALSTLVFFAGESLRYEAAPYTQTTAFQRTLLAMTDAAPVRLSIWRTGSEGTPDYYIQATGAVASGKAVVEVSDEDSNIPAGTDYEGEVTLEDDGDNRVIDRFAVRVLARADAAGEPNAPLTGRRLQDLQDIDIEDRADDTVPSWDEDEQQYVHRARAAGGATDVGAAITAAAEKTTPADADMFGGTDSAAGGVLKKFSWANIKATLKTYFDTLYSALGHTHANASSEAPGFLSAALYDKLQGLESSKFVGQYTSLESLASANPAPAVGSWGLVNNAEATVQKALWDSDDAEWIILEGAAPDLTPAEVLALLLENEDTNILTDAEQTKLDGISSGADVTAAVLAAASAKTTLHDDDSFAGLNSESDPAGQPTRWSWATIKAALQIFFATIFAPKISTQPLTEASPVALNWDNGRLATITLTASRTMADWTGTLVPGALYCIAMTIGGSGGYQLAFPAAYGWLVAPVNSPTAGHKAYYWWRANAAGTGLVPAGFQTGALL
jgi:hypothetical protein